MPSGIALGLLSTLFFGLRHGIDYDHIAAITDITSVQRDRRTSMRLGLLYALGHGLVILLLGLLAVAFGESLPKAVDGIMERVVGATLVVLGVYVGWSLFTVPKGEFRIVSRFGLMKRMFGRLRHGHSHRAADNYSTRSAFVIGMLHGVGAETPTQLGLFLFAAGVGGRALGVLGVCLFVIGLLVTNTVMCAVATGAFQGSARREGLYRGIAGVTAVYSLAVGLLFLFGGANLLPAL